MIKRKAHTIPRKGILRRKGVGVSRGARMALRPRISPVGTRKGLKHAIQRTKTRSGTKKPPSITKLIKEADKILSDQVRQLGADKDGIQTCYTCGFRAQWKKLHCSHYLSRYYKAARWHRDNVRPACFMCNVWKKGDLVVYRRNLINEIGEARVLAVEALRDAPLKLSREYLLSLIQELKEGN